MPSCEGIAREDSRLRKESSKEISHPKKKGTGPKQGGNPRGDWKFEPKKA